MGVAWMRTILAWPVTLLALFALAGAALAQPAVPALAGRVVDRADLIPAPTEAVLSERLAALEAASGAQVAVLTIPSLQGGSLEDYALRVAREWGLGDATRNDGVLFLVARDDRQMRIEVGYGLEGRLTDAQAGLIIRREVVPHFRRGDFAAGISAGVDAIVRAIAPQVLPERERRRAPPPQQDSWESDWIGLTFVAVWALVFFGSILNAFLIRTFGRRIKPGHYRWLGMDAGPNAPRARRRSGGVVVGGWPGGGGGGWSGGGGFSGGGGSFGGGGASGSW